jgi:hypothetical protein
MKFMRGQCPAERSRDPRDDPQAGSVGVFHIESRIQMAMLRHLMPRILTTSSYRRPSWH